MVVRTLCAGALVALLGAVALLVALWLAPGQAMAQMVQRRVVSPLPASDYSVRPVCAAPAPGRAGCLALELVPETAAARAHSHPLGKARIVPVNAGKAAEVCEPPSAAQGCYGLRPQDLHSAYALPTTAPSEQTIAIIDAYDDPHAEADLRVYDEEFHLPPCTSANGCLIKVNQEGHTSPLPATEGGWALEISLDIEVAHATCQNCRIALVEASSSYFGPLETAEETAWRLGAMEISNSWGVEEGDQEGPFGPPGIVTTAATGDFGYLNWDAPTPEGRGFVDLPASSPRVVAVGGTRLSLTPEGAWAGETAWNGGASLEEGPGVGGGGCSESFTAPAWQQGLSNWFSVGCGSMRASADVSADADPYTGVAIYDSTPTAKGHKAPGWIPLGGTSLSSPLIAASFALAGGADGVEVAGQTLYENEIKDPASLHDIQSGSNGECTRPFEPDGLSGCTILEEQASCSGRAICVAGLGYDGPTGVGTPNGLGAFQSTSAPLRQGQTIEFTSSAPSVAAIGGPTYNVSATASSGLEVSFSTRTPAVCLLEEGNTVSYISVGACTIDADQVGDSTYDAAPQAQQTFAVGKGSQVIEFTSEPPEPASVTEGYAVSARSSVNLLVSFSSETPSVCTVEEAITRFIATGTCTIDANQAGDAEYEAAPVARQSFAVDRGSQQIHFNAGAPSSAVVGRNYAVSASATSGLPVSLSSGTPSVCSVEASTVSLLAVGTCVIDANQQGDANYGAAPQERQEFSVGKGSQLVEFTSDAPLSASVGGQIYSVSARSSARLPVALSSETPSVCSVEGTTVSFNAPGTCTIGARQAGDTDYDAAPPVEQSFAVGKGAQTIEFSSSPPGSATVDGPTYTVSATATSRMAVTFASGSPSVCSIGGSTVYFDAAGTCVIDANQAGSSSYEAASQAQQSFVVGRVLKLESTPFTAGSAFSLRGDPAINRRNGAITFRVSVRAPGTLRWLLTFQNGRFGAFNASKARCVTGQIALPGKCRPAKIVFATGSRALTVGVLSFTVKPGVSARTALVSALKRGRGLPVTALLRFQPSQGASVSHTRTITVTLRRIRKRI